MMIQIAATYWPLTEGGGLQHCLGGSTEAFNVGPTLLLPLIQLRTDLYAIIVGSLIRSQKVATKVTSQHPLLGRMQVECFMLDVNIQCGGLDLKKP